PPAPPSRIHLSPAWSAQPSFSFRTSFASKTPSPLGRDQLSASELEIERPARATLPAERSKRLSLNLPVSSSLSLDLQDVVNTSIGTPPSLVTSSTSDSSISAATSTDSDVSCITQSQSEPLIRKQVTEDSFPLRSGHVSMFTLPPIITSPAFSEVSEWDEEARSSALLSVVVVPRDAPSDNEQKPGSPNGNVNLSDTHQDLIQNFKRFSNCAFTSSSSLSSTGSARQVPNKPWDSSQLSGVESRGSFDGRCKSPTFVNVEERTPCQPTKAVVTTFASQSRAVVEDTNQQRTLSPWEKVALLSRKHIETLASFVPTPPIPFQPAAKAPEHAASATPRTPATLDLPFASPPLPGSPIPNTPEMVLRGMRSQIFESPVIPSHFSTPTPEADGFDEMEDRTEVNNQDELTGVESILSALALDASEDVDTHRQSLQSTPRAPPPVSPTATMNFLVNTPSPSFQASSPVPFEETCVIDDFTKEILNMIPRGDTPSPSTSGSSLNQALVGIGLAFVGTESNSEPDLGILGAMDSVVTRRYLARELSASWEPSCTMDSLSSIEVEEEQEERDTMPVEEELQSSPTIDAIIKMNQILNTESQSVELTAMSPPPSEQVASPDLGSPPSSPEFDLKASGLADGSRHRWVLMQAVRTLVSAARSAAVAPQLADLQISVPESGLPVPPLSAASESSFASSVEEPRTPLCPPLVVVTSPSVGVLLKQMEPSNESIMDEAGEQTVFVIQSDSDSDYGGSDEESGSEYDYDEPFDLENCARSESGGEKESQESTQQFGNTKASSSVISPSSS
ncbi:hypothetical protein FS837_007244, partial [Tulasnella sp. UAMH 9824]